MGRKSDKERKYDAILEKHAQWVKSNTKCVSFRLVITSDEDKALYEHIMKQENKTEYFRALVKKDMEQNED